MNNDLISRSSLLEDLQEDIEWAQEEGQKEIFGLKLAKKRIKHTPAVDAEVVRHGRWIHDINNLYGCSECMARETMSHRNMKNFCPWCGAKMDGDVNAD